MIDGVFGFRWAGEIAAPRGRGVNCSDPALEDCGEVLALDGFRDVVIHAGLQRLLPVSLHGVGSHRDYGSVAAEAVRLLATPDLGGGRISVHLGHLHVPEYRPVIGTRQRL